VLHRVKNNNNNNNKKNRTDRNNFGEIKVFNLDLKIAVEGARWMSKGN